MHGYFALLFCREGGQTREHAAQAVQTPSLGTSQPNQTWPGATGASPVRSQVPLGSPALELRPLWP